MAVLVDTGPIVALLNRRDQWHQWAIEQFRRLDPPLLTCEPVLTEACFLAESEPGGAKAVISLLSHGSLALDFRLADNWEQVEGLLGAYSDVPMSLADACLVRMAELGRNARLLTLDRHFTIYRKNRREAIPLVFPWSH